MMKLLRYGYNTLLSYRWELLSMYFLHLVYGSLVGSKIKSLMSTSLGDSLASEELHTGLDSDIFADLIRHEGLDLSSIIKSSIILLPIFLLLKIIVNTGIIANISKNENGVSNLIQNAKKYFFKNLGVSLVSLLAFLILNTLFWAPFIKYSGSTLQEIVATYSTEKVAIQLIICLLVISFLITSLIAAWGIKAKSNISLQLNQPLKSALQFTSSSALRLFIVSIILLVAAVVFFLLFKWLMSLCTTSTFLGLLIHILLAQCTVISLCKLRLFFIGAVVKAKN